MKTIPVIEKFLQNWKQEAKQYYINLKKEMCSEKSKTYEITRENLIAVTIYPWDSTKKWTVEQVEKILSTKDTLPPYRIKHIKSDIAYHYYNVYLKTKTKSEIMITEKCYNNELLDELLDKEVECRKKKLISKIEKKTGEIIDASGLHFGVDAGINGIITGKLKTVKVETIYAGGYNVQCLHYRLLVK